MPIFSLLANHNNAWGVTAAISKLSEKEDDLFHFVANCSYYVLRTPISGASWFPYKPPYQDTYQQYWQS